MSEGRMSDEGRPGAGGAAGAAGAGGDTPPMLVLGEQRPDVEDTTAEELARRANTSSSTVVRFAQALGFEGFPELQAAARDEYRRARENGAATTDLTTQPLFPIDQTEFETALAADHANMAETARKVDRDEVAAAIDLISRAERIVLCGTDQMAFFASYLRHLLMLLDLRAEVVALISILIGRWAAKRLLLWVHGE